MDLRWSTVPQVAAYEVQVAHTPDFAQPLAHHTLAATEYRLEGLASGDYYWRVRSLPAADAAASRPGPYGDARRFSVRLPLATEVTVQQGDDALSLSWDGEAGQRYLVQIGEDAGFARLVGEYRTASATLNDLALPGGTYHLRVQATDADGYVRQFSTPQQFRVARFVRNHEGVLRTHYGQRVELP